MTAIPDSTVPPEPRSGANLAAARPLPNGIGGGLFLFSVLAMLVTPLVLVDGVAKLILVYQGSVPPLRSYLLLSILQVVMLSGLAFYAGFSVFTGSRHGRTAAIIYFSFQIIAGLFMYSIISEDLPEALLTPLKNAQVRWLFIPLLWLLYFGGSRRCKNTYAPEYSHIPIRKKPLSLIWKILLILWGAIAILVSIGFAVLGTGTAASSRAEAPAPLPEMVLTMDVGGVDIAVPTPAWLRSHRVEAIETDGFILQYSFVAQTPDGIVEYSAGNFSEGSDEDWNPIAFTYYKNDVKASVEEIGDEATVAAEGKQYIVLLSQEEHDIHGFKVKVEIAEAYVLANNRLARFAASSAAGNRKVADRLPAILVEWVDKILAANAAP